MTGTPNHPHPIPPPEGEGTREATGYPWSLIVAALAAMGALYLTAHGFDGLLVMAALLVLSRLVPVRLPSSRIFVWMLRALVLAVVVSIAGLPPRNELTFWYFQPDYTNLIGYLLAAELTLRAWDAPPRSVSREREARGVGLFLSALVLAAASNTPQRWFMQWLAPLWLVAAVATVRSFTFIRRAVPRSNETVLRRAPLMALRLAALGTAIFFGGSAVLGINRYDQQLSTWAMDMLQPRGGRQANSIGIGTDPHLGSTFNPVESADRVLLINGRLPEPHLRMLAFDTYAFRSWRPVFPEERGFYEASAALHAPANQRAEHAAAEHRLSFTRLDDTAGLLPVPLAAKTVTIDEGLREDDSSALRASDLFTLNPYQVTIPVDPRYQGPLCDRPNVGARAQLLAWPIEVDPRIKTLARQIAGPGGSTIAKLLRLQQSLRSSNEYSLSFQPQGEPLNDFILNRRAAHCEYFASAMVVMARAIGVPARFVTGFYAHETYGLDATIVRQRDAHAWAECYVDGAGWLTLDATPSGGRPDHLFPDPPRWRRAWERLADLPGQVRDFLSSLGDSLGVPTSLVLAGVLALWLIGRVWLQRRRRERPPRFDELPAELAKLAVRFETWLRRQNGRSDPTLTWQERTAPLNPDLREQNVRPFLAAYDCLRFGDTDPASLDTAAAALDQITQASSSRL